LNFEQEVLLLRRRKICYGEIARKFSKTSIAVGEKAKRLSSEIIQMHFGKFRRWKVW
jgi:hypothetical protein